MGAEQPGNDGLPGEVGRAREAGRERAGEQLLRGGVSVRRDDEREAVALAQDPGVHHDHPLGREQRAVDQAPVARLLEIVGEQALQAGEGARPRDAHDGGRGGDDRGPVADAVEPLAVEPEVELSHGPKAARRDRGR